MNEAPQAVQHSTRHAEIKATHFNSKGEVLFNPVKEQPKQEGKLDKVLRTLRREALPQEPEGPKHVLETLNEIGLVERADKATDNLYNVANDGVKQNLGHDHKAFYSVYGSTEIFLDVIAQAKVDRSDIPNGSGTPELVQTPPAIQKIFQEVIPSSNAADHEIVKVKILRKYIQLTSRSGARVEIVIPDASKAIETPSNHLGLTVDTKDQTHTSESTFKSIMERYSSKESLLNVTEDIVRYVEDIGKVLPEENKQQGEVVRQKEKMMKEAQKWLVSYSDIKEAKPDVVPEESMAKNPVELAEKMKDPKYLPSHDEILQAFDNETTYEFHSFCDKNKIYEFFNQEYIASLSNYLVKSIEKAQGSIYLKEIRPIVILEAGAGNGKLTYHLQQKMREMGLREDQVKFVATDDKSWDPGESVMEVENLDADQSVKKYQPDIVIFSWMPPGEDLSPALRQNSVGEYILIGPGSGGSAGNNETWGLIADTSTDPIPEYERDGFSIEDLGSSGDYAGIVTGQIGRESDVMNSFKNPGTTTTSFKRIRK